jgi:transposase
MQYIKGQKYWLVKSLKNANIFTMKNTLKVIRNEFRKTESARYFHRLHGVFLVLNGLSTVQTGKLLDVPQRNIARWVKRFKEDGVNALHDSERSGRPQALNAAQRKALSNALAKHPKDFGLKGNGWTGALVAEFLRKRHGIRLTIRHCRRLLKITEGKP